MPALNPAELRVDFDLATLGRVSEAPVPPVPPAALLCTLAATVNVVEGTVPC